MLQWHRIPANLRIVQVGARTDKIRASPFRYQAFHRNSFPLIPQAQIEFENQHHHHH